MLTERDWLEGSDAWREYDAWRQHEEDRAAAYLLAHEFYSEDYPFPMPADAPTDQELVGLQ